jgi:hypothetical protein
LVTVDTKFLKFGKTTETWALVKGEMVEEEAWVMVEGKMVEEEAWEERKVEEEASALVKGEMVEEEAWGMVVVIEHIRC